MSKTNRTNCHINLLIAAVLIIFIAIGCGPPKKALKISPTACAPSNLTVRPNSRQLFIKWDTECPDSILLSGYYIYLSEKPLYEKYGMGKPPRKVKPFNEAVYPGDTDEEDRFETITIENLDNGTEYFVSVRTVYADQSVSVSSNEVGVICRPEGIFDLAYRYSDLNDGFSFAEGTSTRADGEKNDLYFYHQGGFDFIASPQRLNGFIRKSKFYSLGKSENIYQYPDLELDIPPVEKMPVKEGESYLIKTADGNYAKIRVEKISGEGKQRVLTLSYIYQTVPGLMRF
ncbi:MAG TPA: hypothetical protein ENH25_01460 [candidate division Zixibacteria bacterium]|nr:hypothetical protein [candidate division Zixibacteria bacterium]